MKKVNHSESKNANEHNQKSGKDSIAKELVQNTHAASTEKEADVLYQRLNGKWYAFTLVDDEVFMGAVDEADLPAASRNKPPKTV